MSTDTHTNGDTAQHAGITLATLHEHVGPCIARKLAADEAVTLHTKKLAAARDDRAAAVTVLLQVQAACAGDPALAGALDGLLRAAGIKLPAPSRR